MLIGWAHPAPNRIERNVSSNSFTRSVTILISDVIASLSSPVKGRQSGSWHPTALATNVSSAVLPTAARAADRSNVPATLFKYSESFTSCMACDSLNPGLALVRLGNSTAKVSTHLRHLPAASRAMSPSLFVPPPRSDALPT
tara:strand:+ start:395 stop:820 length:426 start_codon:yes stop_codon:yes gene_type:complete